MVVAEDEKEVGNDGMRDPLSFPSLMTKAYDQALIQKNITDGFGIHPFDPEAIPESVFARSFLTDQPEASYTSVSPRSVLKSSLFRL